MCTSSFKRHLVWQIVSAIAVLGLFPAFLAAADQTPARSSDQPSSQGLGDASNDPAATRILLRRKSVAAAQSEQNFLDSLEHDTGQRWHRMRGKPGEMEVIQLNSGTAHEDTLRKLRVRPDIEYAVIDGRKHAHAIPNDSLFANQWYLQSVQAAAIGADTAWDTTTGSSGVVIAVLDTGVRFDHPDLARAAQAGKLLPGYDFVSPDGGQGGTTFLTANDGDGWDPDPTDPGDWIDSTDHAKSLFSSCDIENSSWHGTRVSGLIAAGSNNGIGIAGTSWQSWILPVRVLGKCGGFDSDILAAMRWAAGLSVSGVPTNPYPAKIINLSLGSDDPCNVAYQQTIQELSQAGVIVVASAGNSGGPVETPANCPGVVAVAGLRHAGTKVGYSSLGPEVALAAPAGNCVNSSGACLFSLDTTYDLGRTTPAGPGYTDQINTNLGTSFSAPLASGVAALMQSVNAKLPTQLVRARLMEGARTFPTSSTTVPAPLVCHVPANSQDLQAAECICTTATCGAGMLYAPGAVAAALRPIASITPPTTVSPGATLNIAASTSSAACNRTLVAYGWTVVPAQSTVIPTLTNADQPVVQVTAPASGSFTLKLTVTDDKGATDSGTVTVTSSSATATTTAPLSGPACPAAITVDQTPVTPPSPPVTSPPVTPSSASTSGGGGGQMGTLFLLSLIALGLLRRKVWSRPLLPR